MKMYFIRHGQTDWNIEGNIQGSCDIELNAIGINQAEQLSKKIIEEKLSFAKIYSSNQKRALQTAEIISQFTGKKLIQVDGLQEINFGEWEGYSWGEVKEKYSLEYAEWFLNRRITKPPKGESYQELVERVLRALCKIIQECDSNIAIVTHGAVIMCLQCYITGTDFAEMTKFKAENTSIVELNSSLLESCLYQ